MGYPKPAGGEVSRSKGTAMPNQSEEFAQLAKAERRLCDEAGPLFAAIIRSIEKNDGLRITEVRVSLDGAASSGSTAAICTIVHAKIIENTADGPNAALPPITSRIRHDDLPPTRT
jgi:hypothetical protein